MMAMDTFVLQENLASISKRLLILKAYSLHAPERASAVMETIVQATTELEWLCGVSDVRVESPAESSSPRRQLVLRDKVVLVPIRRRTGLSESASDSPRFREIELPGSPVADLGVESPASPTASPTLPRAPSLPGSAPESGFTPLVAQVLVSLNLGAAAPPPRGMGPFSEQARLEPLPLPPRPTPFDLPNSPLDAAARAAAAALVGMDVPSRRQSAVPAPALFFPGGVSGSQPPGHARRCSCKRSQCLKMYCECFAAGGICGAGCGCVGCSNTAGAEAARYSARASILAKDPEAFETKVSAVGGHRKGCKCTRSRCQKKYCECYHAGVACTQVCQCKGCENCDPHSVDQSLSNRATSGALMRTSLPISELGSSPTPAWRRSTSLSAPLPPGPARSPSRAAASFTSHSRRARRSSHLLTGGEDVEEDPEALLRTASRVLGAVLRRQPSPGAMAIDEAGMELLRPSSAASLPKQSSENSLCSVPPPESSLSAPGQPSTHKRPRRAASQGLAQALAAAQWGPAWEPPSPLHRTLPQGPPPAGPPRAAVALRAAQLRADLGLGALKEGLPARERRQPSHGSEVGTPSLSGDSLELGSGEESSSLGARASKDADAEQAASALFALSCAI